MTALALSPPSRSVTTELAEYTTLALGGPAQQWLAVTSLPELRTALDGARDRPLLVLGGGSNVVCADAGFPGTVIAMQLRGLHGSAAEPRADVQPLSLTHPNVQCSDGALPEWLASVPADSDVWLHVAAGESWDDVVEAACRWGLAGIECLSGIPGKAGATPIQNVGAYGQELSDTLWSVLCMERATGNLVHFPAAACQLGYRHSRFKAEWKDAFVVIEVVLKLRLGGDPTLSYAEIAQHFAAAPVPSLAAVRRAVLATRRGKSLLFDRADPNSRNCGSFFVNPVVDRAVYGSLQARVDQPVPGYPVGTNYVKLPAAWLIERAGFAKGERRGNVGLSTKHTLCLVAHDGATSRELVDFARLIRDRVHSVFGVELVPEPVFVGLPW